MEPFFSAPIQCAKDYESKVPELAAYFTGRWLTDLASFSAFTFATVPDLNWAGFYLFDGTKLVLGPFCGKPACTEIRPSKGVCGTAFSEQKAMLVDDVEAFPGHITCDSASRSELVLPLMLDGECLGVLDLDSPNLARFTASDQAGLELWLNALLKSVPATVWRNRPWA